ncbi:MAG TPA: flavodoxin domain-containing protein [Alphaproteobacteria bacterium]|nr:flavodoxin domain-containing protein [Alphaproteobacteria bacterium]
MADILILVGTESGNAQMVADLLKDELAKDGHAVEVEAKTKGGAARLARPGVVLVCCSTHGEGELPENIRPLYDELARTRPDLSHLRYGVIALGDQSYRETFCRGGKTIDALFASLGAERIGERLEIDACTQPLPDEEALDWAKEWVSLL